MRDFNMVDWVWKLCDVRSLGCMAYATLHGTAIPRTQKKLKDNTPSFGFLLITKCDGISTISRGAIQSRKLNIITACPSGKRDGIS